MQKCIWTCVLHIQMALRTTQNRPKSADFRTFSQLFAIKKRIGKKWRKKRLFIDFWSISGSQSDPENHQNGWRRLGFGVLGAAQLTFWPSGTPRGRFWSLRGWFESLRGRFWSVLDDFFIDFCWCLVPFSTPKRSTSTKRRSDGSTMRRIDESTNRPIDESTNHRLVPSFARRNARSG